MSWRLRRLIGLCLLLGAIGPLLAWREKNLGDALFYIRAASVAFVIGSVWVLYSTDRAVDPKEGRRAFKRIATLHLLAGAPILLFYSPARDWLVAQGDPFYWVAALVFASATAVVVAGALLVPETRKR